MNSKLYILTAVLVTTTLFAQHEGHEHHEHEEEAAKPKQTQVAIQTGSGTSWMPGTTPPYMAMYQLTDKQHLMLHGNIAARYLFFDSPRAENTFSVPNWLMSSLDNRLSPNDFLSLRVMLSLDRITEGGDGYPLLMQTGETWQGKALVDQQHPHDLFGEAALMYKHLFSSDWMVQFYAGLPGEPALGPTAFMHRASAMSNPDAPLGHHWQDATHISFGVLTAGVAWRNIKLEGSVFNGTEPDEERFGFDKPQLGSFSSRLSYNPTDQLSFQVSGAKLKNPERNGNNATRLTASGMYTEKIGDDSWWATTAVWGQNDEEHEGKTQSVLLESQYTFGRHHAYGRFEVVEKLGEALGLEDAEHTRFTSSAVTAGYQYTIAHIAGLDIDAGAQASYLFVPPSLESIYGSSPVSGQIILSIHPMLMGEAHLHR